MAGGSTPRAGWSVIGTTANKTPSEARERALRLVLVTEGPYTPRSRAMLSPARPIGYPPTRLAGDLPPPEQCVIRLTVLNALERENWLNNRRLPEPIWNMPPATAGAGFCTAPQAPAPAAWPRISSRRQTRRSSMSCEAKPTLGFVSPHSNSISDILRRYLLSCGPTYINLRKRGSHIDDPLLKSQAISIGQRCPHRRLCARERCGYAALGHAGKLFGSPYWPTGFSGFAR